MTACFKLARVLQSGTEQSHKERFCPSCVYFTRNLDPSFRPNNTDLSDVCGLDFQPGDANCDEIRTNACSVRKRKV